MRLISAVEQSLCVQIEGGNWWFGLEFIDINVVLDVHLKNGITSALSLHLNCTPSIWNL